MNATNNPGTPDKFNRFLDRLDKYAIDHLEIIGAIGGTAIGLDFSIENIGSGDAIYNGFFIGLIAGAGVGMIFDYFEDKKNQK